MAAPPPPPPTTASASTTRSTSTSSTYKPFTLFSFPTNPLTTTFTPTPTDCSGISVPTSLMLYMIHDQTSCLPNGFATAERSFFSPGVACPSGYWSACHDNNGAISVTTVTCCPTYAFDISMSCVDPATLSGRFQNLFCTWTAGSSTRLLDITESLTGRTSTVVRPFTGGQGLNAYGVRMVYQSSDMKSAPTGSGLGEKPTSSSLNSDSTPENSSSNGLTTGAVVAIGILVPLGIIALALGFFFLWRKRRRQHQEKIANSYEPKTNTHFYGGPPILYEGRGPSELATPQHVAELSSTTRAVELPAEPGPQSSKHPIS